MTGAALTILATAACSPDDPGTIAIVSRGDVRALVAPSNAEGGDALITGKLAVNDADCLGVASDAGTVALVVWPDGTTLADDGTLVTPDGDHVEVGDEVNGGGGEVTPLPEATSGDVTTCETGAPGAFVMVSVEPGDGG